MGKRLFVGGLPFSMTEQSLSEMFSQVGVVESVTIVMDKFSGRSKGFGFVEMGSEEDAQKAISTYNNTQLEGRTINVNEARPMEERPRRDDNRGGGGFHSRRDGHSGHGRDFRSNKRW